jgi:cell division septation protein DedD
LTNNVAVPVTNILNIEPYEDKIVEADLTASNSNAFSGAQLPTNSDEFVMDETSLKTPEPALEKEDNTGTNVTFTEKEVGNEPEKSVNTNIPGMMVEKSNPEESGNSFIVQAGAFTSETAAMKLYDLLKKKKYDVFTTENTVKGKKWIRVKIGYFNSISEARSVSDELKNLKINALVLKGKK